MGLRSVIGRVNRYFGSLSKNTLIDRWGNLVQSRPWLVIILTTLFVCATVPGLSLITFNNDYRIYFSPDNKDLMAWESLLDTYSRADGLVVAVESIRGERVFSPDVMPAVVQLTDKLWRMHYVTRVDSVSNFQHTANRNDEVVVEELVPQEKATTREFLLDRERIAYREPLIKDAMLSKDGTATGVFVQMMIPKQDGAISAATAEMLDLKQKFEAQHPNLRIHLGGLVMLNGAFDYYARLDMKTILPVMFAITTVVMMLVFRSVVATLAVLLAMLATVMSTMGIAGYMGIPIGPHSSVSPQIIKTISVATMIYVVLSFIGQLRAHRDKDTAIRQAVKMNIVPISLSSFTAAVGFFSMLTSVIPPFRHIGIMCGMGTLICYVLSLTFLPSLLTVLPTRAALGAERQVSWHWPEALAGFITKHYRVILLAMVLLPVPAFVGFTQLQIDDNFVRLFKKGTWFRDDADFIDAKLAGTTTIDFNLHSGASNGLTEPSFLRTVEDVRQHLLADPMITHVAVFTDTLKRVNKSMHGDDPEFYRIPSEKTAAAQYLLFYEMSLPFGLELNSQINIDKSELRLTATSKSSTTKETIEFVERTNAWLEAEHPSLKARAVSVLVMFSYMAKAVAINAFSSAGIAIVLVVLVIMVGLRSIRLCLIAILSNLVPIVLVLGIWHWAGQTLDFTAGLIFSMTFGVIVDNSLHIMYWYSQGIRNEGRTVAEAVTAAIKRRGPSMLYSTLTLVLGFSVFGLSSFFVNVTLGLLTALVFAVGVLWDLFATPSLLMLLEPHAQMLRRTGLQVAVR